jgi:homoserine O-acetyltransferase/O-succinyltransferase
MTNDLFDSSDSVRNARPLKYVQYVTFDEPLELELGESLPQVTVAYETYGRLNSRGDNAILICHALTGDSHVARHDESDDPGWWEIAVGPGKSIDTDRYFIICPNILGGCRGTTGPNSINPETGRCYATDFPVITVGDIVEVQRRLIDHLGICRLNAVVGASLGGSMVLIWATRYADRLAGAIAIGTAPRLTSQAMAFDVVGRNAIIRDPAYQNGQYYNEGHGPLVGLAIARMLAHITYLSREAMTQKFDALRLSPREVQTQFETKFSVGSYLAYQGDRFGERFDANSYLTLTMAIDLFDLGDTTEKLIDTFKPSTCRWLMMSFTSDWLFPPFQTQQMVDALIADEKQVIYCNVRTDCGHDAFLLPNELATYGELMAAFLANLDHSPTETEEIAATVYDGEFRAHSPRSIFHTHRLDYNTILELIPPGSSVLDLGCGTGGLLARLHERGPCRVMGVELDEQAILACTRRGLDVVHADLNQGLPAFNDGQFDFVVLSQTLQTVLDAPRVLADMMRVGRRSIVSFPNIAYRSHREQLNQGGHAPHGHALQTYRWYDTPNVRFLSIADFEEFCREHHFQILQQIALDTEADIQIHDDPNLNADLAIVVLGK